MKPTLSIIIVNYNTRNILRDCLNNLNGKYEPMEIVVVDNSSTDGSAEMAADEFSQVNLIRHENKGLAAGYNQGIAHANGQYLLFLGSDAFPQSGTIAGIIEYLEVNKGVCIATAKLILRNGGLDLDAHRGFPTPWNAFTHFSGLEKFFPKSKLFGQYFKGWENMEEIHEIDMCISHFMLVKKEVFSQIGLWDESYWLYGEDVDLCYRAKQAGWKVMYLPRWQAIHYKGASVGVRKQSQDFSAKISAETKAKARQASIKAMEIFYNKHYANRYSSIITKLIMLGIKILAKVRG